MTRKEFSLVSAIIQNIGKRNYEKQRKLKPDEYTGVLGDVRYLKDHIFGFSEEDDFVKRNKKLL